MKIYNQEKTEILENVDLDKGYLKEDKICITIIPLQEEIKEQYHYETVAEYSNGGKDIKKVVDIPYQPYIPEHEEYEQIQVYIPYTQKEINKRRIAELKQCLANTDYQAIKHFEGYLTDYEYEPIKAQRQAWRDEINELEKLI
jgi:hypothetical protein